MNRYTIEHNGQRFVIEAPDEASALGLAQGQQPSAEQPAPGMFETGARGVAQGLTFGLADESYGVTQGVANLLRGGGFGEGYSKGVADFRAREEAGRKENPITATLGEVAGGVGTGLGAARAGLTLMRGATSLPQAIGRGAIEGAGYGALHGAGTATGDLSNRLEGAQAGATTGAIVGGAVPVVARGIGAAFNKAIAPVASDPSRQAAVDILAREGVPVSAGQRTGSKALQYAESFLGDAPLAGGQATRFMGDQAEAFTEAAMKRMGASGRATPENLSAAKGRIGQVFNDLSARNTLQADQSLVKDLGTALNKYGRALPSQQKQVVGNYAAEIVDRIKANNGMMPGNEYQTIRSELGRVSRNASGKDDNFADAARAIRNALDDNMSRSIKPEDAAAWKTANKQYAAMKTIERAAAAGGENAAAGLVSPAQLRIASMQGGGRSAYAQGQGDFAELARAGNQIMTPLPNSGTAQRNLMTGGIGGAAIASSLASPVLAAATVAAPAAAGRALWSNAGQRYLGNQPISPAVRAQIEQILRAAGQGGAQVAYRPSNGSSP
jgi:hypothetical protein